MIGSQQTHVSENSNSHALILTSDSHHPQWDARPAAENIMLYTVWSCPNSNGRGIPTGDPACVLSFNQQLQKGSASKNTGLLWAQWKNTAFMMQGFSLNCITFRITTDLSPSNPVLLMYKIPFCILFDIPDMSALNKYAFISNYSIVAWFWTELINSL